MLTHNRKWGFHRRACSVSWTHIQRKRIWELVSLRKYCRAGLVVLMQLTFSWTEECVCTCVCMRTHSVWADLETESPTTNIATIKLEFISLRSYPVVACLCWTYCWHKLQKHVFACIVPPFGCRVKHFSSWISMNELGLIFKLLICV